MEVMMKTFNKWSHCLAVVSVLAILFLIANPASAAKASDNKNAGDTTGSVTQAQQQNQNRFEQGVGDPQGPRYDKGPPGCYEKVHGKDNKTTYQYFKNGHPLNPSEWVWVADDCTGYGK
jgi:hypothetical protein